MVSGQRIVLVEIRYFDRVMPVLERNNELLQACKSEILEWYSPHSDFNGT